jgi:F-type H+-transporting ATPase subunit b
MATPAQTGTTAPSGPKANFPPFDKTTFASQLVWLAILFGLLYWMMAKVVVPRLSSILADRRARIDKDLDDANAAKVKADAAFAAYEKSLAEARAGAQAIGQEAHGKITAESEAKRKALEADLAVKLGAAEQRVTDMKNAALANVGGIARDAAAAIVERLIGKVPGADAVDKAVAAALPPERVGA